MRRLVPAIVALLSVAPIGVDALTIRGQVVNGTTDQPAGDVDVIIVNPSGGMAQERVVKANQGAFVVTDLGSEAPIYLVRVDFDGVMFSEPVRPADADSAIVLMVYESTTSWSDVDVSVPYLVAQRNGTSLEVEQLFEVNNLTSPPRAIRGNGPFHFRIPTEHIEITGLYVTALGMPIERSPQPAGAPGHYFVDYPIRPGVTRIGVSYRVPYDDGAWTLSDTLLYDVSALTLYGVDPDMTISASVELVAGSAAHDMTTYTATNLRAGTPLVVSFAGGSGRSAIGGGSAPQSVTIVPNALQSGSLMLMLVVWVAMTLFVVVTVFGTRDPLTREDVLRTHYDRLAARLARLDDLHAAGVINTEVHRTQRVELKAQLVSMALRLRSVPVAPKQSVPVPEGERSRVS